ncbi:MAG: FAD-dependent oxidoreductase [Candidatus Pacebacteria bacterium]|nr:FAD-dependent oxidoreductase [Candidatus Paceibacterota bacterium]
MELYDLIIVGGGPAGAAASVYAARKRLKTLLLAKEFGGQSTVSPDIQNWIGTPTISGTLLAENLKKHVKAYASDILKIREGENLISAKKDKDIIVLKTDGGEYKTKTLLIATGSDRRKITVTGADKFEHKGLTYCASCDGPLFSEMDVAVLGGGNAAFETAAQLFAYCKSVTLINRSNEFRADPITVERVLKNPKMRVAKNAEVLEVKGDKMVSAIVYKDITKNEVIELPVKGIFVEIGQIPNTSFVKDLVSMNKLNQIIIDPRTQKTSVPGIWAAGDCTDVLYHQNNIAAGDAVRALEDIYVTIHTK